MAESGYNLTKDMVYYNDDNTKAIQDYSDAIKQAKVNIAALNPIEAEVSSIIKAAQDRRNQRLVGTLGLTLAQIQDKYKDCFAEENIQFYDADTVTNTGSTAVENCNDGIDNDLNGLIDAQDPACQNLSATNNGIVSAPTPTGTTSSVYGCQINTKIPVKSYPGATATASCDSRTEDVCTLNNYIDENGQSYQCEFTGVQTQAGSAY